MAIKNFIFTNLGLKIAALFLALVVWITISGQERTYLERTFEVNVECINVAKNIDVRSVSPEKVRIKIKGTSKEINRISADDFALKLDMKEITESTKINRFSQDNLRSPENIQVVSVYPQWIEVSVEEFMYKSVPIKIIFKGRIRKGLELLDRQIVPEQVKIFGYKSQLRNINEIEALEAVDLAKIEKTQTIKIFLRKDKEILRFEDTDSVKVSLVVGSKQK